MRGTRRMWLRRFLRIGDLVSIPLKFLWECLCTIGSFIAECWGPLMLVAFVICIIGGLGRLMWWDIIWSPQAASTEEVKDAMTKDPCVATDLTIRIKQGRPIAHRAIADLIDTCKAQATQRKALPVGSNVPPSPPAQVPDRWATPDEVRSYAIKPDTCIKNTMPGWRKNVGGGPLHYSDLNDIEQACKEQHVLDDQLAAIPK